MERAHAEKQSGLPVNLRVTERVPAKKIESRQLVSV
jgi:hypothetical protein